MLEESKCFEKILTDYSKNVSSKENYYFWANEKYQSLTKLLNNPKNSQLVYKALNLVMYLDPVSLADKKLRQEVQWDDFFEWDRKDIKESMLEEFDPEGTEKKWVTYELNKGKKSRGDD